MKGKETWKWSTKGNSYSSRWLTSPDSEEVLIIKIFFELQNGSKLRIKASKINLPPRVDDILENVIQNMERLGFDQQNPMRESLGDLREIETICDLIEDYLSCHGFTPIKKTVVNGEQTVKETWLEDEHSVWKSTWTPPNVETYGYAIEIQVFKTPNYVSEEKTIEYLSVSGTITKRHYQPTTFSSAQRFFVRCQYCGKPKATI